MPNPCQTDDWIATTLREAETPPPPVDLTAQMIRWRRPHPFVTWFAASGIASMAAMLVVAEILQPSTSLAQVANAQAEQTEYTLTNTRLLGNGKEFRIIECRNGSKWSIHTTTLKLTDKGPVEERPPVIGISGVTVMDGDRTVTIRHNPPLIDVAEIDEPSPLHDQYAFDIHSILRDHGRLTKNYGAEWRGRTVDRFELRSTYRDGGRTRTIEQTVIADAKTHLPLRVEVYRDNRSWGDTWDYDYGRPSEDLLHVDIPPSATVFDLKKQRLELQGRLTNGAVFISWCRTAQVLFPASGERTGPVLPIKVNGSTDPIQANLSVEPGLGTPKPTRFVINGKPWELAMLVSRPDTDFKVFKPFQKDVTSLKIGDHRLTDVPVLHIAETRGLLRPFLKQ